MDNFEKVKNIIAEEMDIPVEDIKLESKLVEDLGADSLNLVEMMMAFETEYDVEIPDESMEAIETVEDVVKALNKVL